MFDLIIEQGGRFGVKPYPPIQFFEKPILSLKQKDDDLKKTLPKNILDKN